MWHVIRAHDGDFAIVNFKPAQGSLFQSIHRDQCEEFMERQHANREQARQIVWGLLAIGGIATILLLSLADISKAVS